MSHPRFLRALVATGSMLALTTASLGQATLDYPVGQDLQWPLMSGPLENADNLPQTVFSQEIEVAGAAWLRLYFGEVQLGAGSFVRITSLSDNEFQELDAPSLEMWSNSTAYFNGDRVLLELVAGPKTQNNSLAMDHVAFEPAHSTLGSFDLCGICGPTDDRVPSSVDWAGRLMPVGCSATIWNEQSCAVSAGHCMQAGNVMQFRVPNSLANCSTVNPPVAEQFPVLAGYQSQNGGVGADWAVMRIGNNSSGQSPFQRYGVLRPIATALANVGDTATVNGYGVEEGAECTRSQTQQFDDGPITVRNTTHYLFTVDITFGNSGSSLQKNAQIIGIVTHCSQDCPDYGTRVDVGAFATARNNLCPGNCTAPSITQHPGNQTTCTGGSASFTVQATGSPAPSYQWRRGTTNLSNGGNISGAQSQTLVINPVQNNDADNDYNCVVANACGSATSNNATLTVNRPPGIQIQPSDQSACAGNSVNFSVTAVGTAPLSYQWRRGNTNLVNGGNISGATTSSLTINPVGAGDAATDYNVVITNSCGSATSNNATLTVNLPPSFTTHPASQTVCEGDSVTFNAAATGSGTVTYQWRKNGVNIPGATGTSYAINSAAAGDAGAYDVVASNFCAQVDSNDAALTVNACGCDPCDTNCDGSVNPFDIQDFVGLLSPSPGTPCSPCAGDANGDGSVNAFDINAFVACLGG